MTDPTTTTTLETVAHLHQVIGTYFASQTIQITVLWIMLWTLGCYIAFKVSGRH